MPETPLNTIAARYQTIVSQVSFPAVNVVQVLQPNPRRWYVRFEPGQGSGLQQVLPLPNDGLLAAPVLSNLPLEYKFRDCPSVVTGGFIGTAQMGTAIIIIECVYLD